jgi:hypothetical protein
MPAHPSTAFHTTSQDHDISMADVGTTYHDSKHCDSSARLRHAIHIPLRNALALAPLFSACYIFLSVRPSLAAPLRLTTHCNDSLALHFDIILHDSFVLAPLEGRGPIWSLLRHVRRDLLVSVPLATRLHFCRLSTQYTPTTLRRSRILLQQRRGGTSSCP